MLVKNIKYTDYNGVEREEKYYFNLSKAEAIDMELSKEGGFGEYVQKLVNANDIHSLIKVFKDLILLSYGEKSEDGKSFIKVNKDGHRLADDFAQTEAFSELYSELALNAEAGSNFIQGIMPKDLEKKLNDAVANIEMKEEIK